jgi:hypothetical protein
MSVRNGFVLLLALSALLFLAACGNNGNSISIPVAPPTGNFSNSNLNGTYVFSVSGTDFNGAPYAIVGTITANGTGGNGRGGITAGTIDINDSETTPAPNLSIAGGGFYSVGVDGRGTFTIGTTAANPFGANMTFDFVLSSSSHGLITQFDGNGSGSGTIDLQSAGVTPAGSYAFSFAGGTSTGTPWATVGNFTISGASVSGLDDLNEGGLLIYSNPLSGSLTLGPSSSPATTLTAGAFSGLFDVFAIDASHLKFIEMDTTATLSGDAFTQSTATIPIGTMAFTMAGETTSGSLASGGFMTTVSTGGITGTEDYNVNGSPSVQSTPGPFTATYTAAGTGRYTLGSFGTFVPANSEYVAYPSSGGLLLMEIDSAGVTTGAAYPQTAGATMASSQGYGLNLSGVNLTGVGNGAVEVDDIAEFSAVSGGTVTGIIDENFNPGGIPTPGIALSSGTYGTIDSNGRYGVSAAAANNNTGTLEGGFTLTAYTVDGTTFPFIELDGGQVASGVFVLQNPAAAAAASDVRAHMFIPQPIIHPRSTLKKKTK